MRRSKYKRKKIIASIAIIAELCLIAFCLSAWFVGITTPKIVYIQHTELKQTESDGVINYIKEVFGKDADRAILLLMGNSKCHGENPTLDPNAIHDNEKWGQGLGLDVGVFQVSSYWNKIPVKFLLNYKININVAYQIYKENGDFHLWTAGRCLHI